MPVFCCVLDIEKVPLLIIIFKIKSRYIANLDFINNLFFSDSRWELGLCCHGAIAPLMMMQAKRSKVNPNVKYDQGKSCPIICENNNSQIL